VGGCKTQNHKPEKKNEADFEFEALSSKVKDVCEPYRHVKQHYGTTNKSETVSNTCGIDIDNCLSNLVHEFMTQNLADDEHLLLEEWVDYSDSSSDEDMYEDGPSGLISWPEKLQAMQVTQCQIMFAKRAKFAKKCHFAKFRTWARDVFQECDREQCDLITRKLIKGRCEDPKLLKRKRRGDRPGTDANKEGRRSG